MALKGKDSSGWKDASAVYGKDASGWLYAKEAWAKNASGWQRAWTDCRLYDATGGRGWSDPVTVVTYNGSCGNRTQTTTITRTKTGCPNDVRATTVASPDCNQYDTNCYNAATGATEYRYSCASRESRIVYTFTPKADTACATQYSYTDWVAAPDCGSCGGACWTDVTGNYTVGQTLTFAGVNWTIGTIYGFANFAYKTADPGDGGTCGVSNANGYSLFTCGSSECASATFGCIPI